MKFLFEVHIRDGHTAEEYAEIWQRASQEIQRAAGALGTELRRKFDDPKVLLAIASWDSRSSRDAMERDIGPKVADIIRTAAPICDIRLIGEFDEPDWVVPPQNH